MKIKLTLITILALFFAVQSTNFQEAKIQSLERDGPNLYTEYPLSKLSLKEAEISPNYKARELKINPIRINIIIIVMLTCISLMIVSVFLFLFIRLPSLNSENQEKLREIENEAEELIKKWRIYKELTETIGNFQFTIVFLQVIHSLLNLPQLFRKINKI